MSNCDKWLGWLSKLRKTYQPVEKFEDKIEPERVKGFEKILDTILAHCEDVTNKTFLDIGSNLGYFCFELTKRWAKTTGIELDSNRVEVCKCLSLRNGYSPTNPHFINDNAVNWIIGTDETFDYVLLLNTFHHILVHDEVGGWNMWDKLLNISGCIFVMMRNSYKQWSLCDHPSEIPQSIISRSAATDYKSYPSVHGRVIYVFWKE